MSYQTIIIDSHEYPCNQVIVDDCKKEIHIQGDNIQLMLLLNQWARKGTGSLEQGIPLNHKKNLTIDSILSKISFEGCCIKSHQTTGNGNFKTLPFKSIISYSIYHAVDCGNGNECN